MDFFLFTIENSRRRSAADEVRTCTGRFVNTARAVVERYRHLYTYKRLVGWHDGDRFDMMDSLAWIECMPLVKVDVKPLIREIHLATYQYSMACYVL